MRFKALAMILAAFGVGAITYKYVEKDLDFTLGLEEDEEENV